MNLNKGHLLNQLQSIDPYDFEHLIADLFERRGWNTTVTTGSSDRGIDVVAEREAPFHERRVIQAKRYKRGNRVGGPAIQQYSSLKHQGDGADAVLVVTTSSFTDQAVRMASDLNVKLIDADALYDLLVDTDAYELLDRYIETRTAEDRRETRLDSERSTTEERPQLDLPELHCPFCAATLECSASTDSSHLIDGDCTVASVDELPATRPNLPRHLWRAVVSESVAEEGVGADETTTPEHDQSSDGPTCSDQPTPRSPRMTREELESEGRYTFDCPFCETSLDVDFATYVDHLSTDCSITDISALPSGRPLTLPVDIWFDLQKLPALETELLNGRSSLEDDTHQSCRSSPPVPLSRHDSESIGALDSKGVYDFDCPFCGESLRTDFSDYTEHLCVSCDLDSVTDMPARRPLSLPVDFWFDLKTVYLA